MKALFCLKNNKERKVWLQHRVDVMNKVVKPDNWHYISSSEKPVDVATAEWLPSLIVNNKFL